MPEYANIEAISAGYDVALLDLDLITSFSVSSIAFLPVLTAGQYSRGERRTKANGAKDYTGYRSKQWKSGLMTLAQYDYAVTNFEGPVTAYSWLATTTAARFNAVLDMGNMEDYETVNTMQYGWCLVDVIWQFTMIEVLA